MGLRILHGEHAGELLDACLEEICSEAIQWPGKRAFLIVPEQTKADMERRYLEVRRRLSADAAGIPEAGGNALMLVDVVSFQRFAHRILSEVGGFPEEYLDDATETMLIHRILREKKSEFKVLSALADRIGFIPEIQNVLGDFPRYRITPEKIRELDEASLDPSFYAKMTDFALLMEHLSVRVREHGYCGQGDEIHRLTGTLDKILQNDGDSGVWPLNRLDYLRDTSVWILGFGQIRDFTPQEGEVIDRLVSICEKITISVCADCVPLKKSLISDGSAVFYFGRQTLWNLIDRFPERTLQEIHSNTKANTALSCLADAYASRRLPEYHGDTSSVHLLLLKNSMDELHYVAGEIRRLVLTEGYRYNEISVVLCNQSAYESNLHAVFAEYGLDPFLDKRRQLSGTVLIRFVLSILDLGVVGWSFRPLMTCLKSGMCHITADDADRLENYCLEHGLFKGYRIFSPANYDSVSDPSGEMQHLVMRVLLPIREFLEKLGKAKSCAQKAAQLLSFLNSYGGEGADGFLPGISGQVEALSKEWIDAKDQDAALALAASFNELVELLQKLQGPVGETEMSLLNFRSILSAGMEATFSGAIPSYVDQIQISDTRRGYQRSCRALFLVGAERSLFPFKTVKEGYLRGYERELLAEQLAVPFPSRARDQVYADHFTAYSLLDCPEEKIYLSCPLTGEPSAVFGMARTIFPAVQTLKNPPLSPHDPRLFSKNALQRYIWSELSGGRSEEEQKNLQKVLCRFPELARRQTGPSDKFAVSIPADQLERRYGMTERMSVSQIEVYAACPFQHFGRYVMRLQERKMYESASNVVGTLLHSMFEKSMLAYRNEAHTAASPEEKQQIYLKYLHRDYTKWSGELLKTVALESPELITRDPAFLASDGNRIIRMAAHSLRAIFKDISPGAFEPDQMEWQFGSDGTNPVRIDLPTGRSIYFRGTIDRVDLNPALKQFRIIDYKSGDKNVNYPSLYYGLSVQLPAYLHAYALENPDWEPQDAGYFHLTSPMIPIKELSGKPDDDSLSRKIGKTYSLRRLNLENDELRLSGKYAIKKIDDHCRALFSGVFSAAPRLLPGKGSTPACRYCDFISVCGIDPTSPPCMRLKDLLPKDSSDGKKANSREVFTESIREAIGQKEGDDA